MNDRHADAEVIGIGLAQAARERSAPAGGGQVGGGHQPEIRRRQRRAEVRAETAAARPL